MEITSNQALDTSRRFHRGTMKRRLFFVIVKRSMEEATNSFNSRKGFD